MESVPPNKWTRQAAGDLHPETCRKPAENPNGISPAQQVDTASGRGLTPRNPHQTPTKPPWNQSRPTSGHGKRQGTYTQKTPPNPHQTPMESVPPNKWTRQAAGDLHPETCRNHIPPNNWGRQAAGSLHPETCRNHIPPNNWGRQAARDLHPETCRNRPEIVQKSHPTRQLGTASGRGLTPRNLQKSSRKPTEIAPHPTTGDG